MSISSATPKAEGTNMVRFVISNAIFIALIFIANELGPHLFAALEHSELLNSAESQPFSKLLELVGAASKR